MELNRRAAYLALCAAQEDLMPRCAEDGPLWDQRKPQDQASMCGPCPLKKLCRAYADTDPMQTWGVWGGQLYPRTAKGKNSRKEPEC
jgi:Transcription factor WhiB